MSEKKTPKPIDINLNEDIAQGTYSNLSIISHSNSEFVIDFVRMMPGIPKAEVKSRIILTPENAKQLLLALQDNINRFENMNGVIESPGGQNGGQDPLIPMNFGPTGQA